MKKEEKMPAFHNVWAFLLQLLKVICERTLLALCPSFYFLPRYDLANLSAGRPAAAFHDSFAPAGPQEALEMHAP